LYDTTIKVSMRHTKFLQSQKKISWRFLDGPLTDRVNVVFAGPHFHAGFPSVQQELNRRRGLCQHEYGRQEQEVTAIHKHNNIDILSKIRLIHSPTREQLLDAASSAHVALPFMEKFSSDFFHPTTTPNLRLAIQYGVGLEGMDLHAATNAGIAVSNIPADGTGNAQATSEHALFLAISLLRYDAQNEFSRRFQERSLGGLPIPRTLYQKRVTVVGFGAVGSCLTNYLVTMGADVTVVRRRPWEMAIADTVDSINKKGVNNQDKSYAPLFALDRIRKLNSLSEALPETQVLFLACPLTPETLHCINKETIALLPKGALVINIARGGLVEYEAMLEALLSGSVGGFASDVGIGHPTKPSEPWDPEDEICSLPNVLFTPHVGGYSDVAYGIMASKIVDAIEHIVRGEPPPVWVNKQ
jgi:phosphoglycerate dehydrogenase-like enzyme